MAGHQEWLCEILRHALTHKICWFAVPAHAWFLFPLFFWILKLGMNWTTHDINCRCTQSARAFNLVKVTSTVGKTALWGSGRVFGIHSVPVPLLHICFAFQRDGPQHSFVYARLQCLCSPGRFSLPAVLPHLGVWERSHTLPLLTIGVAEDVARFPLFQEYTICNHQHQGVCRGVHACLLWLGDVAK